MTAEELRSARRDLGLSGAALAKRIGVTDRAVRRWEAGDREVPGPLAALLDLVLHLKPARERFLR